MKRCRYFLQRGLTMLELTVVLLIMIALAGTVVPYVMDAGRIAQCQATDATLQAVKAAIMGGPAGAGYYADLLGQFPGDKGIANGYSLEYLFIRDNGLDDDGDGAVDADDEWPAFNPQTLVGWRGPYLQNGNTLSNPLGASFSATAGVSATVHAVIGPSNLVLDGWGRPLILQVPDSASCDQLTGLNGTPMGQCARLVSAGPGNGIGSVDAEIDTPIADDSTSSPDIENIRQNDDRILYLKIAQPVNDRANDACN